MNATITEPDAELDEYVAAVGTALADLPATARTELLEDLASHLREYDRSTGSLRDQLGDPAAYAAELRASAGFAAPAEPSSGTQPSWLERRTAAIASAVTTHPWWRATADFLPELRPAWWVVRAWAIVAVLAGDASIVPSFGDNPFLGLLALAVLVPLSVRHGRRSRLRAPNRTVLVLAAGAAAAVVLLGVVAFVASDDGATYSGPVVADMDHGGPPPIDGSFDRPVSMLPVFTADGSRLVRHDSVEELNDGTVVVSVAGERRRAAPCPDGSQRLCLTAGTATATTGAPPITFAPGTAPTTVAPAPPTAIMPPPVEPPATTPPTTGATAG